ncbi:MAG: non-homologous end-joining DNA ligase [Nitrososphaerota archaeon]|jgi:bifunctional non-homologous end joining protein LigD|uniref:non-homologous end-joining DNA ligase n=1 Tax=Candidatus Bathycorpusculum sp. TaxID=2994959 RepID=UPI0028309758|nr:non-homologous end-joining DNA ligase [Candidatus Termitimicrobium sp.]MCL2430995.1 non-homologous end-joining DNA ligase [Candidatus Termitimicrobium sp.]MDR0493704.1 non-homologous end-joining DNA ligase [Nitrososphaerota archaeon]
MDFEELKTFTKVKLKNLDKCFYPQINVTKSQVVEYYIKMAPKILPLIAHRPLVLTRYPDGVDGHKMAFFAKNAPQGTPEWVKTEPIYSSSTKRNVNYIVCNDIDTLIWLANLAALEIHMPFSILGELEHPDLLFFDIDPEVPATISDAAEVALLLKDKLYSRGFTPFVKTSGKKGLHVIVPIVPRWRFEQTRRFVHQIGIELAKENSIVVSEFKDTKTPGKVFVDYLQNSTMRTMVIPYSLRPTPEATVSTPLEWHRIKRGLDPLDFNIFSVTQHSEDPWRGIFNKRERLSL